MSATRARLIHNEVAAGLADAERQIAFLETAKREDVTAVLAIMAAALDDDADPRLTAGVCALRRILRE